MSVMPCPKNPPWPDGCGGGCYICAGTGEITGQRVIELADTVESLRDRLDDLDALPDDPEPLPRRNPYKVKVRPMRKPIDCWDMRVTINATGAMKRSELWLVAIGNLDIAHMGDAFEVEAHRRSLLRIVASRLNALV